MDSSERTFVPIALRQLGDDGDAVYIDCTILVDVITAHWSRSTRRWLDVNILSNKQGCDE